MAKKKAKNNFGRGLFVTVLLALTVALCISYHKQITRYSYKAYRYYKRHYGKHHKANFTTIEFPYGYKVHGIDVSHFQEDVDWERLQTSTADGDTLQFQFAFIKATEGIWKEDVAFDDFWTEAHDNNVICGAYHYFLPDRDALRQANNFISSVKLERGDLPPAIDIEETKGKTKAEIVAGLKIILKQLEVRYGVKPIIYSNISFIEDYLSDDFGDYNFWVAHYYEDELEISDEIHWVFWQHNDKAMIFGCDNSVDVNVFNGNQEQLKDLLLKDRLQLEQR